MEAPRPVQQVMAVPPLLRDTVEPEPNVLPVSLLQIITRALDNPLCPIDKPPRWKPTKMARARKTTATKKTKTCIVSARSSHTERWVRRRRSQHTWLTIGYPQMVGCDDEDCRFQWVMSIPRPRASPVALNSFFSSTWGVLVSKIPQRVVGTVLSVPPDAVRNTLGGHQGKEGKRTLVTDVSFRVSYVVVLHVVLCSLCQLITSLFFIQDAVKHCRKHQQILISLA